MAKGGNSQRSNGSRFTKPYNASNSFVTKVASRVSDYLGGWFGTPLKSSSNAAGTSTTSVTASGDTTSRSVYDNIEVKRPSILSHRCFDDDDETMNSPAKRFKISDKEKVDIDFPISPIPSTSGLFQSTINHTFDIPKSEDFVSSVPGPSSLRTQRYGQSNSGAPATSTSTTDVKANGANDNHSDSSESTSGCSSLVPQSDRLSQSAYICSSRKRNLEEKLNYARQLQQSRASMYLNRSIPVNDAPGGRKKPSFDVTAYGTPPLDKSLLKEKLMNSPFYTGQTSYGGASAYRLSRNTFYSQRNPRTSMDRREGMQVQVKPSHHGSTEDLSNMSHTAKKILEALEQFSTPVSDAKRIPINRLNVPLGSKRRRFDDLSETRLKMSTPISPLNPNPGPVITGLNVPTVPDLLKLKRLERIQNSTAAARQVAVQKQEYNLPSEIPPTQKLGKIKTKLKDKGKDVPLSKLEEVNLPKIPLPITTLPKFDLQLPPMPQPNKPDEVKKPVRQFTFSPPTPVSIATLPERSSQKNNFTFSDPLKTDGKKSDSEKPISSLANFMSSDAVTKLKRKSINDNSAKSTPATRVPSVPAELKTGSVMDFFNKSPSLKKVDSTESSLKSASGTWECAGCLIRNLKDSKICRGCKANKVNEEKVRTSSPPKEAPKAETKSPPVFGFGDKFKPPSGSWSCKECFVNNNASAAKCVACESPKVPAAAPKEAPKPPPVEIPKPAQNNTGFGDLFKKQANQWECSVCMIRNKETDTKCVACETPKPGSQPAKPAEPKFNFGIPPGGGGFKFGIDKAGVEATGVKSLADSSTVKAQSNGPQPDLTPKTSQFGGISTSVGVFTFGIPPSASTQQKKEDSPKPETPKTTTETTNSGFMVTSTSGTNIRKDAPLWEQSSDKKDSSTTDKTEVSVSESTKTENEGAKTFFFGAPSKPLLKAFGAPAPDETKPPTTELEAKAPKFFFGSNSNSLETVSSSTTDFTFGQTKPTTTSLNAPDPKLSKPAFQVPTFGTLGSTEATAPKPGSDTPVEVNKTETPACAVSTSATVAPLFGSNFIFNNSPSKLAFGTTSTSSSLAFGNGNSLASTSASPFAASTATFASSGFNSQPSAVSTPNSFGLMSQSAEKPAMSTNAFGGGSGPFASSFSNPFASTASSNPIAPPRAFGTFGNTTSAPTFGSKSTPTPAFGAGFLSPSPANATEKPPAPFGTGISPLLAAPASTSAPAPVVTAPGVFTFGASKPEAKPSQFSFGQSSGQTSQFGFGSNQPMTSLFGGMNQPKPENSLGTNSPFGSSTPTVFGQSSAPAAVESTAPKFEFGAPAAQQQENTSSVFQFGAAPAQPSSAPASAGFSLSVPNNFNFTGGQIPTFSASAEAPSAVRSNRKMIKAVRRTNRDNPRRGN